MTSRKQIEANRANARLSTGPKTKRGKGRSRVNALTHGQAAEKSWPKENKPRGSKLFAIGSSETCDLGVLSRGC